MFRDYGIMEDGNTGSELCLMAGFGAGGVENFGYIF
jgi:hypothetical protein